jgi:predicted transcriptional regulator
MGKTLIEMTADIVRAQSEAARMLPAELANLIDKTYKSLKNLAEGVSLTEETPKTDISTPAIDPKTSIQKNKVICLECGKEFKILSGLHLRGHALTARQYKQKYGFSLRQPLTAKSLSAARRKIAIDKGLGQKMAGARKKKQKNAPAKAETNSK